MLNGANTRKFGSPSGIAVMTMSQYKTLSGGYSSRAETRTITELGKEPSRYYGGRKNDNGHHDVFKVRTVASPALYGTPRVIVLSDKPKKALPWDRMEELRKSQEVPAKESR